MAYGDGPFGDLKVPLAWTAAVALIVAVIAAVALLMADRRETVQTQAYGAARQTFDTVDKPIAAVLSKPGDWLGSLSEVVGGYFSAVAENRKLRHEVEDMRRLTELSVKLADENARLRAVLGLRTEPPIPMATGRAVLDARGPFSNTRLINVGVEQGVNVGNPVMNERGLIGRIVGVGHGVSRVLLLTDVSSKTPVMADRTDARAILSGDGGPNPKLAYLRGKNPVREGDRILTSGDGGVFPRGLPVGRAAKGLDGTWRVRLDADVSAIDYVRVLKFQDFTQLANLAELEKSRMPPPVSPTATPQTVTPVGATPAAGAAAKPVPAPAKPKPASLTPPKPTAPPTAAPRPALTQPAPPPAPGAQ
ncbi:MAG: rod shape-determining protein MreC [Caulobacteraceae bacterium]